LRAAILVAALHLLPLSVVAQPAIPDTAMGNTLSDYLAAVNSGDAAQINVFKAAHHYGVSAEIELQFSRLTGGLAPLKIESSDASIVVLVKEKQSDTISRLTISEIGTADAPKLSVSVQGIPRPAEYDIPRLSQTEAIHALDARAAQLLKQGRLSGNMAIERDGKIIYKRNWGAANRETHTPVTLHTKFRIGSDNKMFTAVATLQLVAAGKLSLQDTVGKVLPDYPNKEIADKVTIQMLLTHSGGTGDFFGPEFDRERLNLKTHADYVKLFGNRGPLFEPGTQDRYSNYGYLLLGRIIEAVSGQDYYDYVQDHVFRPAGMTETGSLPESVVVPGRSTGYTFDQGQWVSNGEYLPYRGAAPGGGYSTLGDFLLFAHALRDHKLLPKFLQDQATGPRNRNRNYGYGFGMAGEGKARWIGHGGGSPGMNAEFRFYPESGIVIVALCNMDPPVATILTQFYANRMPLN
jgi:D-alanyl-D-alanine carboxypeptidase